MKICAKCGYARHPQDDLCFSTEECPKCGIIYKKYEELKRVEEDPVCLEEDLSETEDVLETKQASRGIQYLKKFKDLMALLIFSVCLLLTGYWFYLLVIIDVNPQRNWRLLTSLAPKDPKEAMVILFFGGIASIFILIACFFLLKYAFNLFWGKIEALFQAEWNTLIRSIALLLLISFSFPLIKRIKRTGFAAFFQIHEIVRIARENKARVDANLPVSAKD